MIELSLTPMLGIAKRSVPSGPIQIWRSCCFYVPSAAGLAALGTVKAARASDLNRTACLHPNKEWRRLFLWPTSPISSNHTDPKYIVCITSHVFCQFSNHWISTTFRCSYNIHRNWNLCHFDEILFTGYTGTSWKWRNNRQNDIVVRVLFKTATRPRELSRHFVRERGLTD